MYDPKMYNPTQPYPSQRAPVAAANLVATSQPLATQAGIDALRRGGNAVDAALAAAITLTVVEPNNNGVGSDAFCILWDGQEVVGLNASGRAPAAWNLERFSGRDQMPTFGWDAVTVPGAVSAWVSLSERYGALAFEDLFEAAIHYAEEGFNVGPKSSYYWQLLARQYERFADFAEHFLPAPQPGQRFRRPDLAHSLKLIAASRGEAFYQGELAQAMEDAAIEAGGALRVSDLAAHTCEWMTPVSQAYRGVELHEIPPNGQGLAALIALGILQHLDTAELDSPDWMHQQVEAMKIGIKAAFEHFADPRFMHTDVEALLSPDSLRRAAGTIQADASRQAPVSLPLSSDTVYLTAADRSGMMVSFIQSNFLAFGSGIVIPKTGISMQNRGSGFVLDPDHPNCVAPGKRPFHTIIPGFVTAGGAPLMSFGVMGGHMQHQGHVQMVTRICEHGQNPQAASDAPRWHVYPDYSVGLEAGIEASIIEDLRKRGHACQTERQESVFGGAQLIQKIPDGYVGGSDHRKEGLVSGF
jgi:gamma-glutamyltranspeptidase/glutathione hydrolase